MTYLIDTQSLLWIVNDDPKLSRKTKRLFLNSTNTMLFSLAGLWEMAIKISLNKLVIGVPIRHFIENDVKGNDIQLLPIRPEHVATLENLPYFHKDPFDRMIIAQAMTEAIPIISSDALFDAYSIKRIW